MALLLVSTVMSGWLTIAPHDDRVMAAVFPPWWGAERSFAAAGAAGSILRQGAWPWIVVVAGDGPATASLLHRAGALFLVDPAAAGICGPSTQPQS